MSEREANFERMLSFVQEQYERTTRKMEELKAQGKTKTATYRQLLGDKLYYQKLLSLYKTFDLL